MDTTTLYMLHTVITTPYTEYQLKQMSPPIGGYVRSVSGSEQSFQAASRGDNYFVLRTIVVGARAV
jgi:hypothetical protein